MARSKFIYIEAPSGVKLYLDSVAEVTHTLSGSATQYFVEAGYTVSDHYSQNMDTIQISGVISKAKIMNGEEVTDSEDFVKTITGLKNSGQPFTVSFSNILTPFKTCVFESLSIKTNTSTGVYAYEIEASITSLRIAQKANTILTPVPLSEFNDVVDPSSEANSNSFETEGKRKETLMDIGAQVGTPDGARRLYPQEVIDRVNKDEAERAAEEQFRKDNNVRL